MGCPYGRRRQKITGSGTPIKDGQKYTKQWETRSWGMIPKIRAERASGGVKVHNRSKAGCHMPRCLGKSARPRNGAVLSMMVWAGRQSGASWCVNGDDGECADRILNGKTGSFTRIWLQYYGQCIFFNIVRRPRRGPFRYGAEPPGRTRPPAPHPAGQSGPPRTAPAAPARGAAA